MCVIVDANVASKVFSGTPPEEYGPLRRWLDDPEQDGCLVYGGQLGRELQKVGEARRYVVALLRAGRARLIPDVTVDPEAERVAELCESNDGHVIALARVSGARTLCTEDQTLWRDFNNKALINNPRGKIYRQARHSHLLRHSRSCGRLR